MLRRLGWVMAVVVAGLALAEVPAPSRARWLWTHEKFEDSRNQKRCFRAEFTAEEGLKKATLVYVYDDLCTLTVNGVDVERQCRLVRKAWPKRAEVTKAVRAGGNAIAAEIVNQIGMGGLVAHLELEYADGRIQDFYTDGRWKCSRKASGAWRQPGYDDRAWEAVNAFCDISENIWAYIYPMRMLLDRAENRALEALYARRQARGLALQKRLADEPKPVCAAEYADGRVFMRIGGKRLPLVVYAATTHLLYDNAKWRAQVAMMAESGIALHAATIDVNDAIWKPDGTVDTEAAAKIVQDYLEMAPGVYLSVGISFARPPYWWRARHPEECIDYANGGRNLNETHVQRNFAAPSYASAAWLEDTQSVITQIVRKLESTPLAARIFSYRVDSGVYTEWHYYGMPAAMPDCSRPMTEAFRRFLKRKYATEAALREAWGDHAADFASASVPGKAERLATGAGRLRSTVSERKVLDYFECMGEVERDCVLAMNRAAKRACGGRVPIGNYYGYFFGMNYPAEGWHLRNDEILDDPATGFQISPNQYGADFRALGRYGSVRALADSYRLRGKFCIIEADTRTFVEPNTGGHTFATDEEESIALLARDFAHAFAHGCGLWFMDFSRGWYMPPKIQEFFRKDVSRLLKHAGDFGSAAEVAVVGDFDSVPIHAIEENPNCANYAISMETPRELGACQIPYDMLSFGDLAKPGCRDYKVYLFLNNYLMTPEKHAVVERLKRGGHTLVWTHVPGYFTERQADLADTAALTGIALKALPGEAKPRLFLKGGAVADTNRSLPFSPVAAIADGKAEVLGEIESGGRRPALAWKAQQGWNSVLCTTPYLPRQALKAIFAKAGVFRYCDNDDAAVYANASMVMLHTGKAGRYTLRFPRKVRWQCLFPEERTMAKGADTLVLQAKANTTYFFACD